MRYLMKEIYKVIMAKNWKDHYKMKRLNEMMNKLTRNLQNLNKFEVKCNN